MANEGRKRTGQVALGNLQINFDNFDVFVGKEPVTLSLLEFETLRVMLAEKNKVLPYTKFSQKLWHSPDKRTNRNLAVIVHRLRRKLANSWPFVIRTVRGRGYGLVAELPGGGEEDTGDGPPAIQIPPNRRTTRIAGSLTA